MMTHHGIGTPYWYEWEIGIIECLKMLYDDSIEYVIFQDPKYQSIDDVVVKKNEKTINIQVKHTDVDNKMTYSFFDKNDLLKSWAVDWQKNGINDVAEIYIYSNMEYGTNETNEKVSFKRFVEGVLPELRKDYNYNSNDDAIKKTIEWYKGHISFLGDDAPKFTSKLFFKKTMSLEETVSQIKDMIKKLTLNEDDNRINNISDKLHGHLLKWTTSLRQKTEIYKKDVYEALSYREYKAEYDFKPQKPIFNSRVLFAKKLEELIGNCSNKVFFINGSPGIGKTNFVSYLAQKDNSVVDFRFYTYKPVDKCDNIYSDDYGKYSGKDLWLTILYQLSYKFSQMGILYEIQFPLLIDYIEPIELKKIALKFLDIYSARTGKCIVFIDGIDHAARFNDAWNRTYLPELPAPSSIPDGVKFVIVGQPNYPNYPTWINDDEVIKIEMPGIDEEDLLSILEDSVNDTVDKKNLAKVIINTVGNNTLNVLFAISEAKRLNITNSFDDFISALKTKKLNENINNYYNWIHESLKNTPIMDKILFIFAFSNLKIHIEELRELFKIEIYEMANYLSSVYPLIVSDEEDFYYVYHNDVRIYLKNKLCYRKDYKFLVQEMIPLINSNLKIKHDILIPCLQMTNDDLFKHFNIEFIKEYLENNLFFWNLSRDLDICFKKTIETKKIENIVDLSIMTTSIFQINNCHLWMNDGEDLPLQVIDVYNSEKYVFTGTKDVKSFVFDIHSLLKKGYKKRAELLYLEIIQKIGFESLKDYCFLEDTSLLGKLGYILRCLDFRKSIDNIQTEEFDFLKGWMDASEFDIENLSLNFAFMKKKYIIDCIDIYLNHLIKSDKNKEKIDLVINVIKGYKCSLGMLFNLYEFYLNIDSVKFIKDEMIRRKSELIPREYDLHKKELLLYYKYLYYCYEILDFNSEEINKDFVEILKFYKIYNSRGYKPAVEIFNCFITLLNHIKGSCLLNKEQLISITSKIMFCSERYGTGSTYDFNYFSLSKFLYRVLYQVSSLNPDFKDAICEFLIEVSQNTSKNVVWELMPLLIDTGRKEEYIKILDSWYKNGGKLWDYAIEDIYNIGEKMIAGLNSLEEFDLAKDLKKKIEYKSRIGYVGHKDYSFYDLADWYSALPSTSDKLGIHGIYLLALSDFACEQGDNRGDKQVIDNLIDSALDLGAKYLDALFDLKNTNKEFYYWREKVVDRIKVRGLLQKVDYLDKEKLEELIRLWGFEIEYNASEESFDEYEQVIIDKLEKHGVDSIIEDVKQHLDNPTRYSKPEFLRKILKRIDTSKIQYFYDNVIRDYIVKRDSYGFSHNWKDKLIIEVNQLISDEDYILLLNNCYVNFINGNDWYNIKEDIETLCYAYITKQGNEKIIECYKKKIKMHEAWIGIPDICSIATYNFILDEKIKSYADFCDKMTLKI